MAAAAPGPWVVVARRPGGKFRARKVGDGVEVEWQGKGAAGWEGCEPKDEGERDGHRRGQWRHQTTTAGGARRKEHTVRDDQVRGALGEGRPLASGSGLAKSAQAHHDAGDAHVLPALKHSALHGVQSGAARRRKRDAKRAQLAGARAKRGKDGSSPRTV